LVLRMCETCYLLLRGVKTQTWRMQRDEAALQTRIYLQTVHHSITNARYTAVCAPMLPILFNSCKPSRSAIIQTKRDSK